MKKERRHCEHQRYGKRTENFIYRERSIDDGSHFDPHLDKYTTSINRINRNSTTPGTSTLRKRDQQSQTADDPAANSLKRNKKLGGFEKVKQLFGAGHGTTTADKKDGVERKSMSSTTSSSAGTQQTIKAKEAHKDSKYMVKEEEMRSRYREYNGSGQNGVAMVGGGAGTSAVNNNKTTTTITTTTTTTNIMQNDNMREPKVSENLKLILKFGIFCCFLV